MTRGCSPGTSRKPIESSNGALAYTFWQFNRALRHYDFIVYEPKMGRAPCPRGQTKMLPDLPSKG